MSMTVKDNVEKTTASIAETALRCGRAPEEITLCAVSKYCPLQAIEEAYAAGARVFGESRVQEIDAKMRDWDKRREDAEIQMIGPLQRNKAKKAVEMCSCIQSVDRDSLVAELAEIAASSGKIQRVLFEINAGEDTKNGYRDKAAFFRGVEKALACKNLRVEGLMTMAPFTADIKTVRAAFRGLYDLREDAKKRYPEIVWSTLSMGMSGDYRIAIEEGSTMVRIGSAIFGERVS
jgi:pyridoxal phosphate enzyme (YggS family)